MRLGLVFGALATAGSLATTARDAPACGGVFIPPQIATVVSDPRMIFSVSPSQTTLYDQIKYTGAASSFAWILPIHGQVTVGLSADIVFSVIDTATATTVLPPPLPPCLSGSNSSSGGSSGGGPVTILTQQVVGPYDTVQLSSTSATALTDWLTTNGYAIPPAVQPIIAAYVTEGFDFLAMRLSPGQNVQAMRPVSVSTPGAGLSLPLRMVAAGTGSTVGITLWVVATGRYEPRNFPFFIVAASELTWDWSTETSDIATVRAQKETALHNGAWQVESSVEVISTTLEEQVLYEPGTSGSSGASGGLGIPRPADQDYMAVSAPDGGVSQTADQVRAQDLATLFGTGGSNVFRITRLRGDLSQAALANDLVLQASQDQSQLTNDYSTTNSVHSPCGSSASSSGASDSGAGDSGAGSSGASSSGRGGASGKGGGGGCSASAPGSDNIALVLVSLAGVALANGRRRRR